MTIIKILGKCGALALGFYAFGSFIAADFNIQEWNDEGRFILGVIWVMAAGVTFIAPWMAGEY